MDYQFPEQLFPSYFSSGPPDSVSGHGAGTWGCYDRVRPQVGPGPCSWTSKHQVRGDTWRHTEPVPLPLLSPKHTFLWPSAPPDPLDFTEHMQNFFMDHRQDAFCTISGILGENFYFKKGAKKRSRQDSVDMWKVTNFMELLKYRTCPLVYSCPSLNAYSMLLADSVHAVPLELLGSLLYEELTAQRDRLLFSEAATGGALAFVPLSPGGADGCLVYPGNRGLDHLNFHRVALHSRRGHPVCVDTSSHKKLSFRLKGPIRQISSASVSDHCCVGVRSDHLCGLWRFSETDEPRLLEVVKTKEVATSVSVSPHVSGEVLVTSESGAANLWTAGEGIQKVRQEDANLYFNAVSSWRWCHFSAHPRVMVYADRTGAELTDVRLRPSSSHALFRIGKTAECRSGERLLLSRYLGAAHSFHHLVVTQNSAYIMDERIPCVPMLKWDHMMLSPPIFCDVLPGSASSGSTVGGARTTDVLLGSQRSQEVVLLQCSGGRADACSSHGPPQALLRPRDVLEQLPVQIPHRHETASNRLTSAAAGLACIQMSGAAGGEECICVLQLTEAGDIFYQTLVPQQSDVGTSRPPAPEEEPPAPEEEPPAPEEEFSEELVMAPGSQLLFLDDSSNDDVIGPTQDPAVQTVVAETQDAAVGTEDDSSCGDEESGRKRPNVKHLQVLMNADPDQPDETAGLNPNTGCTEGPDPAAGCSGSWRGAGRQSVPQLSENALATWKLWLQKVTQKARKKRPRPVCRQYFTTKSPDLSCVPEDEDRRLATEGLRRDLRACMAKRSLLVNSSIPASRCAERTPPLLRQVDTATWTDDLSQRLTLSWQGDEDWRGWWEDRLGLNKEAKVEALWRKRRKDKEAKRAGGKLVALSRSFASSVSYPSELDDFSDVTGWSSETSRWPWSDAEETGPSYQREDTVACETPAATTPTATAVTTPRTAGGATPTTKRFSTPQRPKEQHGGQPIPGGAAATLTLSQTSEPEPAAVTRRTKRPSEDDLSSLFASQDNPTQHDDFLEAEGNAGATSSQPVGSLSLPQRGLGLSQSSLGRLSQGSQPKKKKSRMGF